jgi:hypothetical protein
MKTATILHVALAQMLGAERFYPFDTRQRCLAQKAGLDTRPA